MAFQTGASGNPKGRPKGTGSRQQIFNILVEPYRDALINTAINLALDFSNIRAVTQLGLESLKALEAQ